MTPASGATDTMGLEFLSRVRRATLWLGGIAGLLFATYHAPAVGLGLAAGAAWSLVNLFLIETLVVVLGLLLIESRSGAASSAGPTPPRRRRSSAWRRSRIRWSSACR